jgi:two-component system, response regulator RegA
MGRAESAPLSCLVVEDDVDLLAAIARHTARELQAEVWTAKTLSAALELVREHRPRIIVTDVHLGDDRCHDLVVEALARPPFPTIVAISGKASAEEAFSLAALGVRSYLAKPLNLSSLRSVLAAPSSQSPQIAHGIAARVGAVPIDIVKRDVRITMLTQALALTAGNRSECGRILGVTRQAVQHMIKDLDIDMREYNEQ